MGVHISKVKSVDLDVWTPEQMESIKKWGNRRANLYWEAHLKAGHVPPDHKVESFIRSKYESRRWALDGPPPIDPSVLEQEDDASQPVPATSENVGEEASVFRDLSVPEVSIVNALPTTGPYPLLSTALLSSQRGNASVTKSRPKSPPVSAPAPPPDDLFSLDFHSAPTPSNSQGPPRDVKNDIMSLFSATTAPTAPAIPNGTSVWGGSQPWTTAQPATNTASDPWGNFTSAVPAESSSQGVSGFARAQQAPNFAQNVWANSSASSQPSGPGGGLWASDPSNPSTASKGDAFADIWN